MRLRTLILNVVVLLALLPAFPAAAHAATTTPTEAAALSAAENDHTAYTLPADKLAKSDSLAKIHKITFFVGTAWGILSLVLILQLRIAARMRNVAVNLSKNRWAQSFTFLLQFLLITTILGLPLSLYQQSVRRQYGLSIQSWGSYFGDMAKELSLTLVFGGLLVMLLFWLIRKFPRRWWLVLWFPVMAIVLFSVYISPIVIDPLFNQFEPLSQSNPALVAEIAKVARHGGIDIPPERMFLMKASAKVTTLNAYVTGFGGSKRVVVWDTLLAKMTPDEVALVCGHEMGHYILGHILTGILFSFFMILFSFFLGFHLFQFLLRRFGAQWRIPAQDNWAALVVFLLVLQVIGFFIQPVASAFSRSHEHAADVFGLESVHGIVASPQQAGQGAFQVLGENSFTEPNPSALMEFWTDSHPPIWLRAGFSRHYDPWAQGQAPKYLQK